MKVVTDTNDELLPLLTDTSLDDAVERLACVVSAQREAVTRLVENLPEDTILALATQLEAQSGCIGFRVEDHDCVAARLRYEVYMRRLVKRGGEYMERTGAGSYCPSCDGDCDMGEEHNRKADIARPPRSAQVIRINEMSRKQLIAALIEKME